MPLLVRKIMTKQKRSMLEIICWSCLRMMSLQETKGYSRACVFYRTMEDYPGDHLNNNNNTLSTLLRGRKKIEYSLRTYWWLWFVSKTPMKGILLPMFLEFSKQCKKLEVLISGKAFFQIYTGFLADFGHTITSTSFSAFYSTQWR